MWEIKGKNTRQHTQINILSQRPPTPDEWRFMVHLASHNTFYIILK